MFRTLVPLCAAAAVAVSPLAARAAEIRDAAVAPVIVQAASPAPRTISLTTSAHVDYAPDLAMLSLGVHSDASSAAAAADKTNATGAKMLAAFEALGIGKNDVQTTQYDVAFTEARPPAYAPLAGQRRVITQPGRPAFYTVTTTYSVKAPIAKAGLAIDAAVRAGANESYSLSFASSHIDDYYAEALASAMASAHTRAAALALAAGVALDALQTVTTSGAPSAQADSAPALAEVRFAKAAPIAAGTQSVDASVDVVYAIR